MLAGKAQIELARQRAKTAANPVVIDLTQYNVTPPEVAVCWSLFPGMMTPPQGNGMMPLPIPLCWSHQLSIQLQDTALSVGSAADAAMLGAGPGGAYLLGQGG
jgi:hypothetical protein